MGIMNGALTVRRFRVDGELGDGFRERFRDSLNVNAFPESATPQGGEEVEGWVIIDDLLDNSFDDLSRWLFDDWVVFSLRVDKKRLPKKLFQATVARRCDRWCAERGVEHCPSAVREEVSEALEQEWYARTLPSVAVTEAAWTLSGRILLLHSLSDGVADRFRKRFLRTFGLHLVPWSPLDWLKEPGSVDAVLSTAPEAP